MPKGGELLSESHRSGILEVSPSYFIDMHKLMRLLLEFLREILQIRQEFFVGFYHSCDMHDCGKAIIA